MLQQDYGSAPSATQRLLFVKSSFQLGSSISKNDDKWRFLSQFLQQECEFGCMYEEKHRKGRILVSLDCRSAGSIIEWSGCKRFEENMNDLECICIRDGCNIDFLLKRKVLISQMVSLLKALMPACTPADERIGEEQELSC
ncbi:hypothetical protein KIN20_009399 [Parelaphostrongylus tenuis]|uniref:Uncharacterized protein n=1 Tax=Parelaphostrongylus tenuis TaxID=148309 RepID=A0AAD5QKN4_PARTN|nr:hypothetical protein KIN20_009399 [Parelaphostrongylus tenuis]